MMNIIVLLLKISNLIDDLVFHYQTFEDTKEMNLYLNLQIRPALRRVKRRHVDVMVLRVQGRALPRQLQKVARGRRSRQTSGNDKKCVGNDAKPRRQKRLFYQFSCRENFARDDR